MQSRQPRGHGAHVEAALAKHLQTDLQWDVVPFPWKHGDMASLLHALCTGCTVPGIHVSFLRQNPHP